MNPHEHDPELIMAVAEGAAGVTDADRTAVADCSECAEDLAAQRLALESLRAAPVVAITELEAARLMRRLDAELGHERELRAVTQPRRRFSWAPAFSIAAVILVLVLAAPALDLLGGGTDEAGGTFDAALSATTTTVVDAAGAAELGPARALEDAEPEAGAPSATVPPTTLTPSGEDLLTAAGGADVDSPLTLADVQAILMDAGGDPEVSRDRVASIVASQLAAPAAVDACLIEGLESFPGAVASFTLGDMLVDISPLDSDGAPDPMVATVTVHRLADGSVALVAHDIATCEAFATIPE